MFQSAEATDAAPLQHLALYEGARAGVEGQSHTSCCDLPGFLCTMVFMAAQETLLNGRYRLISQQGSGGMAVIYKAQDLALGRTVAVKILRPSLTGDPSFLSRFRQEA